MATGGSIVGCECPTNNDVAVCQTEEFVSETVCLTDLEPGLRRPVRVKSADCVDRQNKIAAAVSCFRDGAHSWRDRRHVSAELGPRLFPIPTTVRIYAR